VASALDFSYQRAGRARQHRCPTPRSRWSFPSGRSVREGTPESLGFEKHFHTIEIPGFCPRSSGEETRKPVDKFTDGRVHVSIWENSGVKLRLRCRLGDHAVASISSKRGRNENPNKMIHSPGSLFHATLCWPVWGPLLLDLPGRFTSSSEVTITITPFTGPPVFSPELVQLRQSTAV